MDPPWRFPAGLWFSLHQCRTADNGGVSTDILGVVRPKNGGYDLGAYERDVPIFVDKNSVSEVRDGTSWNSAFLTIEEAINQIPTFMADEIWVADGVYDEVRSNTGSLSLPDGVTLLWGIQRPRARRL